MVTMSNQNEPRFTDCRKKVTGKKNYNKATNINTWHLCKKKQSPNEVISSPASNNRVAEVNSLSANTRMATKSLISMYLLFSRQICRFFQLIAIKGPKIFVRVLTFRRRPLGDSRNFCQPEYHNTLFLNFVLGTTAESEKPRYICKVSGWTGKFSADLKSVGMNK